MMARRVGPKSAATRGGNGVSVNAGSLAESSRSAERRAEAADAVPRRGARSRPCRIGAPLKTIASLTSATLPNEIRPEIVLAVSNGHRRLVSSGTSNDPLYLRSVFLVVVVHVLQGAENAVVRRAAGHAIEGLFVHAFDGGKQRRPGLLQRLAHGGG